MNILALDLGTSTGWAVHADGAIASGTVSFKPGRFEGGGMRALRFRGGLAELSSMASGIDALYFENVRRHAAIAAAHVYGVFLATLTAWAEHGSIPYCGEPVGSIKRSATGRGNADKSAMITAMRALGHQPADDNEADTLALLRWAMSATTHTEQAPCST